LDPLATGLLLVLVGPATKLAPYLTQADKSYLATIRLGLLTDTLDVAGKTLMAWDGPYPEKDRVLRVLASMIGPIWQRPPMYSAIKVNGQTAHQAARAGKTLALEPREVTARELILLSYEPPLLTLKAQVSKGYYVRALARDLGEELGLGGGAIAQLRRLTVGSFGLDQAGPVPESLDQLKARLIAPAQALGHLPEIKLAQDQIQALGHGQKLPFRPEAPGVYKIIAPGGQLAAVGEVVKRAGPEGQLNSPEGPFLRPIRVFMKAQRA
jgi:tRNA pseudouridine55 synthase